MLIDTLVRVFGIKAEVKEDVEEQTIAQLADFLSDSAPTILHFLFQVLDLDKTGVITGGEALAFVEVLQAPDTFEKLMDLADQVVKGNSAQSLKVSEISKAAQEWWQCACQTAHTTLGVVEQTVLNFVAVGQVKRQFTSRFVHATVSVAQVEEFVEDLGLLEGDASVAITALWEGLACQQAADEEEVQKVEEVVASLPRDRLMTKDDFHAAMKALGGMLCAPLMRLIPACLQLSNAVPIAAGAMDVLQRVPQRDPKTAEEFLRRVSEKLRMREDRIADAYFSLFCLHGENSVERRTAEVALRMLLPQEDFMDRMTLLFEAVSTDGSGTVTPEEVTVIGDALVHVLFSQMHLLLEAANEVIAELYLGHFVTAALAALGFSSSAGDPVDTALLLETLVVLHTGMEPKVDEAAHREAFQRAGGLDVDGLVLQVVSSASAK